MTSIIDYVNMLLINVKSNNYTKDDINELQMAMIDIKKILAKLNKRSDKFERRYYKLRKELNDYKNNRINNE